MFDVITVGSATVDVIVNSKYDETITIRTAKKEEELLAYPLGSKILISDLNFTIGGGGTNSAFTFSKLGLKTAYLGKIGKDDNGYKIMGRLLEENIEFVGGLGDKSGYSIILDSFDEDRTILAFKGCNDDLKLGDVDFSQLECKWFYFSSMMKESFKTMLSIAEFASNKGIGITFNPSSYQCEEGLSSMESLLKKIKVLVINKEEAELLVGVGEIDHLLKKLKSHGPKIVCVTDGAKGVYMINNEGVYHAKLKVENVAETTGAGDAFGSAFTAGLIMKKRDEEALLMGLLNATSVITIPGAKNGILTESEMEIKLKEHKELVKKIV